MNLDYMTFSKLKNDEFQMQLIRLEFSSAQTQIFIKLRENLETMKIGRLSESKDDNLEFNFKHV